MKTNERLCNCCGERARRVTYQEAYDDCINEIRRLLESPEPDEKRLSFMLFLKSTIERQVPELAENVA